MAKAPETGMDIAEMKKLLVVSKREPVSCAVGVGKDQQGLLLMHKTKSGVALMADLRKEFGDVKNPSHGTALVDTDVDAKLVVLTLNKAAGGMGKRLKKTLKGTGFTKVTIRLEDGTVAEAVGEEDEEGESEGTEAPAEASSEAIPEAPPPPPVDEVGPIKLEFAALIPKLAAASGGDAQKMEALKAAAAKVNAAIKANDAGAAQTALDALKSLMGSAPSSAPPVSSSSAPPPAPTGDDKGQFVKMQKSRLIWDSARKKVSGEIEALKSAVQAEFAGDFEETKALDALDKLDDILANLDDELLDRLDDVLNEGDPAKRADAVKDAKETIDRYLAFYDSNDLLKNLNGDTPFGTKLTVGATVATTLKALQASLN